MIEIKTYINPTVKPIFNLQDATNKPTQYFIDIEDKSGMKSALQQLDLNYLNGAIIMEVHANSIMNFNHWDLVDQLWAYLINTVEELLKNNEGSTFFPEQPIKFKLKTIASNSILVTIDDGKETNQLVDKRAFLSKLLTSAERFYSLLNFYFSENVDYKSELNQINSLKLRLDELK